MTQRGEYNAWAKPRFDAGQDGWNRVARAEGHR
jgi:hypothetical protein